MDRQLILRDYFKAEDIVKHGEEAWNKIRETARAQGFRVSNNYATFDTIKKSIDLNNQTPYLVGLDSDGDFMCVPNKCPSREGSRLDEFMKGRLRTVSEFIKLPIVKIRLNGNKELFHLAVSELKKRGYNDSELVEFDLDRYNYFVGLVGRENGSILVVLSNEAFDRGLYDVDEIVYDLKQILLMENFRIKQRTVEVMGVKCDKGALDAFLETQRKETSRWSRYSPCLPECTTL